MTALEAVLPPDDRDLLAAGPVEALVDRVYDDLAELEDELEWAEEQADLAEDRLRAELEASLPLTASPPLPHVLDACATEARAHLTRALDAASLQAEAILAEARLRADRLVADARADAVRSDGRAGALEAVASEATSPVGAPADISRGAQVQPRADGVAWDPTPLDDWHRRSVPEARPDLGHRSLVLPEGGADAAFQQFWAAADTAVPEESPPGRETAELVLLALVAAVMVVLMLVAL